MSGARDRLLAWLVTGPLGRGAAFALDLSTLLYRLARRRSPDVRER